MSKGEAINGLYFFDILPSTFDISGHNPSTINH